MQNSIVRQNQYDKSYQRAWQAVQDNYVYRDKVSHWSKWKNKFAGKLKTREQLNAAVDQMLSSLKDDYSYVLSAADMKTRAKDHKAKDVVHQKWLEGGISHIKVDNISSSNVMREFKKALVKSNSAEGYVLDLRNNHGGFISIAQEMFALLADQGTFMSYEGFGNGKPDSQLYVLQPTSWEITENGAVRQEKRQRNLTASKPMVVLVNKDTRSAAELLAGALRDVGRARIAGETTFGKGVLQDAYQISSTLHVKITTARYYLPNGESIHDVGVKPDVTIASAEGDEQPIRRVASMLRTLISANADRHLHVAAVESPDANL